MNKALLESEIDKFDDVDWVKQNAHYSRSRAQALNDLSLEDKNDILEGYWQLIQKVLNAQH
jgi:hypothetical protein